MSKIAKINSVRIIDDKYVYKKEKDLDELNKYLISRDFKYFLMPVKRENEINVYDYIEDIYVSKEQKCLDLVHVLALLHSKTSYNKSVSNDLYGEIHSNINGYVNYLEDYYKKLIIKLEYEKYPAPSEQLLLNNCSKLFELFEFLKKEIDNWYMTISNKTKQRVCINHGNISLDHFIVNKNKYLISFRNNNIDTPIKDLIDLYKSVAIEMDFSSPLEEYLRVNPLSVDEQKLFFINICIPEKIELSGDESINISNVTKLFTYIHNTEELIRPYYTIQDKK